MNGDGKSEFAVGAIQGHRDRAIGFTAFKNSQSHSDLQGYVDVFRDGSHDNIARITPDTSGQSPAKVATLFGSSISTIGDLNSDGVQEVLVGAPGTYEIVGGVPDNERGAVFIYSGASTFVNSANPHIANFTQSIQS